MYFRQKCSGCAEGSMLEINVYGDLCKQSGTDYCAATVRDLNTHPRMMEASKLFKVPSMER